MDKIPIGIKSIHCGNIIKVSKLPRNSATAINTNPKSIQSVPINSAKSVFLVFFFDDQNKAIEDKISVAVTRCQHAYSKRLMGCGSAELNKGA